MRISPAIAFAGLLGTAAAANAQQVQVTDGWVHAVPPFQTVAPAYISLQSDQDDALTGVSIDSGGTATLEKTRAGKNPNTLPLPAGKTVTLAPGGDYLALVGDHAPLTPGDRVGVTLYFKKAPPKFVELNVLSRGNNQP